MAVNKNGLFRYKLFGMVIETSFPSARPCQTFTTFMQGQETPGEGEIDLAGNDREHISREVDSHDYCSSPEGQAIWS